MYLKETFVRLVQAHFHSAELIAGVSTAGIPHGAILADALNLPFVYVRSAPKSHGLENLIEGHVLPGQKAVVLEDLISTGGSSLKVVDALRAEKVEVLGLAAIFTYDFQVAENSFREAACPFYTLSDYTYLLEEAIKLGHIQTAQLETLNRWRQSPETWTI